MAITDSTSWIPAAGDELGQREDMFAPALAQRNHLAPPLPAMQRRARNAELLFQIGRSGDFAGPVLDQHRLKHALARRVGCHLARFGCRRRLVNRDDCSVAARRLAGNRLNEVGGERSPLASEGIDRKPLRLRKESQRGGNAAGNGAGRSQCLRVHGYAVLDQCLLHRLGHEACQGFLRDSVRLVLKSGHASVLLATRSSQAVAGSLNGYSGELKARRQQTQRPDRLLSCIFDTLTVCGRFEMSVARRLTVRVGLLCDKRTTGGVV
ncbi:hypothetical protein [Mesorhizobium sp. LSJC264A00]|uniref:hypothetical protein n=1 Tax=unclassified Mesorhizobium TaxID=325217 RepID=UPI0032AF3F51